MGAGLFAPPPNSEPSIPAGSDAFDVAPPNFRLIGQMFASGVKDAGGLGSALSGIGQTVADIIAAIIGTLLGYLLRIVAFLITFLTSVDDNAAPGFQAVVASSLAHVFGVPIAGAQPRKMGSGVDTAGAANAIGSMVMGSIISGIGQAPGSTIGASDAPMKQFLGKLTQIGIEGWVDGTIAEALSLGQFKAVMELTPIMADILGLGRLSRRALQVPLKTFVADPFLWFINAQYRPTLLSETAVIREVNRGAIPVSQLDTLLAPHGHSPAAIAALVNLNTPHLSIGDVDYLVSRGHWSQDQGLQELQNDGWNQTGALNLLAVAQDKRIDARLQTLLGLYLDAFQRGDIDQATLDDGINNSNLPQGEKFIVNQIASLRRQMHPKHLSLGEVIQCMKAHIMTPDDLQAWLTRENYPPDEATFLELLVLGEITTTDAAKAAKSAKAAAALRKAQAAAQAAPAKAAAAAAKASVKGISLGDMEKLVELGQKTFADFTQYLGALGLPQDSIDTLVTLLHDKIKATENATVQAAGLEAEASAKQIPLSTVAASVVAGHMTIDDLRSFMQQHNYADAEIAIEVTAVEDKIDKAKAKASAKTAPAAAAAVKTISLPDLERAARLGLTTPDAYAAALTAAGYDAASVGLMVGILNDQIKSDAAALAKRNAAAAKLATKGLSLAQMEQAVIDGIGTLANFQTGLTSLGFSAPDIATLVDLLQIRLANAAAITSRKNDATAKLASKGLTLGSLERAVRLGVLSIAQFSADLTAAGMSAEDVALLAASETASQAQTAAAAAKAATANTTLKARGISLEQEQNLIKNGISTLTSYTAFLTNLGYSAADAADLTQLLSDQIEQAKAAATLHAAAAAQAADKDISLATEEKAVIAGIQTMAQYESYLADLGYDATDQATLTALLEAKMGTSSTPAAAGVTPQAPAAV